MINEYLQPIFTNALTKLGITPDEPIVFEAPKIAEHGDASTNIAMKLAKTMRDNPRNIAEKIIANLEIDSHFIAAVESAGAGFINIRFANAFFQNAIAEFAQIGESFGKSNYGKGKSVNVEYVSVNPTGLLHLGHGRNACIGDTIANLYAAIGYDVTREYYFNNAGNQMNILAKSIYTRYRQQLDEPDYPFPEDGYHGDYVREIAAGLVSEVGSSLIAGTPEDLTKCRKFGEEWCFAKIKQTLERMNIHQDLYFNEDTLYSDGKIEQVIADFRKLGLAYEKESALWLAFSQLGLKDDRVIVKSSGEPTYRLPDIAYHREKFNRGYDLLVDVFGADHIATVPDVMAGLRALGYEPDKVKVLIHQFVTLTENGQQVKMSKRTGKNYTLDDLLDEVGEDVVRFFLIMRGISTHMEFDLGLAREQSDKNPVFYLQYAHARICSVFENAKEKGIYVSDKPDYSLLNHDTEINLIKSLNTFPDAVLASAMKFEPQILAENLRQLATDFHFFYHECRILQAEEELMQARLGLIRVVRFALYNGLSILGVKAPERM
ncbi:MAG: argS [Ignavibacteria bacterium]|nr:argS [Ignavibacteria bacterium]